MSSVAMVVLPPLGGRAEPAAGHNSYSQACAAADIKPILDHLHEDRACDFRTRGSGWPGFDEAWSPAGRVRAALSPGIAARNAAF